MLNLSRPNFFPGQWFDYRDFNRLSAQADTVSALLNRHLLKGGGIIASGLEEFAVQTLEGPSFIIKPGVGILPNGQPVILREETLVSFKDLMVGSRVKTVIVAIRNRVQGQDKYQDPEDASITGFKSEALVPEIFLQSKELPDDALEICRVLLDPSCPGLRHAQAHEEWKLQLLDEKKECSLIDMRMRKIIVPQTLYPLDCVELIGMREALYTVEECLRKTEKLFLVRDRFSTHLFLSLLHSELLAVPLQPRKIGFIASEFSRALSLYLEELVRTCGNQRENLDEKRVMEAITLLSALRSREVRPSMGSLKNLVPLAEGLREFVRRADEKYSMLDNVTEALADQQDCRMQLGDKLSLAGYLFRKVYELEPFAASGVSVDANGSHERTVSTAYKNGETESRAGVFIAKGAIQLDVRAATTEQALVVVLPQYVRRAGSVIHYEVNGKHLSTTTHEDPGLTNVWINRGLVIPKELLVPNTNRITIRVERADLDFGFFGCSAYQPTGLTEVPL